MQDLLAVATLWSVILVSSGLAGLYFIRVVRHHRDPMRWLLLGVLASLALTTVPLLALYNGDPWPMWAWELCLLAALASVVGASIPLVRDTWREVCAYAVVARDSYRVLREQRRRRDPM
jgi:hypothetical protein